MFAGWKAPRVARIGILLLVIVIGIAGVLQLLRQTAAAAERTAADPAVAAAPAATTTQFCRYGVNNLPGAPSDRWIAPLGSGFYLNFVAEPKTTAVPAAVEFVPAVRMQQKVVGGVFQPTYVITPALTFEPDGLGTLVQQQPGRLWLVGNEVDVNNSVQDRMTPQMYARVYHEVYTYIKQIDPTAYVGNAGLSMMTPGRMQYMDIVWNTYQQLYGRAMPVDVWNFHLYILSERNPYNASGQGDGKIAIGTDPALARLASNGTPAQCPLDEVYCRAETDSIEIFQEQVINMRTWMKNHGQQNKPLILSEFSILYPFVDYDDPINPTRCFLMDEYGDCFTQQRVSTYLKRTMNYLANLKDPALGYPADDNRLVQQWKWFSMWTRPEVTGGSSNLLLNNYQSFADGDLAALTQVGQTYRQIVSAQTPRVNLVAGQGAHVVAYANHGATGDARISAGFFNNGNVGITPPFRVTFYADAGLTQAIGTAVITAESHGVINGCAWGRNTDQAAVVWQNVPIGTHTFWAKIDSQNDVAGETDEDDNVTSGTVRILGQASYLPILRR